MERWAGAGGGCGVARGVDCRAGRAGLEGGSRLVLSRRALSAALQKLAAALIGLLEQAIAFNGRNAAGYRVKLTRQGAISTHDVGNTPHGRGECLIAGCEGYELGKAQGNDGAAENQFGGAPL